MATWLNHVTIAAPRNGTTSHTVDPASTSNVVAGEAFATTAGRLLLCFADGTVTSTTPSGWTLPTNGSTIGYTGLYVWTRTAGGGDTITTSHSPDSDYSVIFDIYEFLEGSVFLGAASTSGVTQGTAGPTLTGLSGTHWDAGIAGQTHSDVFPVSLTWDVGTTAVDYDIIAGGSGPTDGCVYSLSYIEDSEASSATFTADSNASPPILLERLVVAVSVSGDDASYALGPKVFLA